MHPETVFHLFWTCEHTQSLWQGVCHLILDYIYDAFVLCLNNVLFGFINYRRDLDDVFFLCNLIIFLAKFYIHKTKPNFTPVKRRQRPTLKHDLPLATEKLWKRCSCAQNVRYCCNFNILFFILCTPFLFQICVLFVTPAIVFLFGSLFSYC